MSEKQKNKWQGIYSSEAEREVLKEAADNKINRDIERAETIHKEKVKRVKVVVFAVLSVAFFCFIGYGSTGIFPPLMWGSPVTAGIFAFIIHRYKLNRLYGAMLFFIPGLLVMPLVFVSLAVIAWGAVIGRMSEAEYRAF